jgi:hypothetical protein
LAALTVLKKICDHPGLLSANATHSVISGSTKWEKRRQKHGAEDRKSCGFGKTREGKNRHGYVKDDDFIVGSSEEEEEEEGVVGSEADEIISCVEERGGHAKGRVHEDKAGEEEWARLAGTVEDKLLQVCCTTSLCYTVNLCICAFCQRQNPTLVPLVSGPSVLRR